MSNEFPRMLYRSPKPGDVTTELQGGALIAIFIVNNDEDAESAKAEGWRVEPPSWAKERAAAEKAAAEKAAAEKAAADTRAPGAK